jgi:hypothetical protein
MPGSGTTAGAQGEMDLSMKIDVHGAVLSHTHAKLLLTGDQLRKGKSTHLQ